MNYRIKIVGTSEIPEKLDDTQDYSIALKRCSVKSTNRTSNADESGYTYTYSLESLDIITIIGAGNKVIQGQGKSRSKQMRARMYQIALDRGVEPEAFYQQKMTDLIIKLDELI
jgi:hypothetical protein